MGCLHFPGAMLKWGCQGSVAGFFVSRRSAAIMGYPVSCLDTSERTMMAAFCVSREVYDGQEAKP